MGRNWISKIVKGVIGGAFAGLFVGVVLANLTVGYVIQRTDYVHATLFEMAERRYCNVVLLSVILLFVLIGPFFAAVSFGPWLRHAMYGLLGGVALVVGIALLGAWVQGERPFYGNKVSSEENRIAAARGYGIPAAFVIGPLAGVLIGRYWKSGPRDCSTTEIKSV